MEANGTIRFRDKDYTKRELFIRDEAKVAKLYRLARVEDEEIRVDCYIKILGLTFGIQEADLNGCKLKEITDLMVNIAGEKKEEPKKEEALQP